MDYTPGGSVVKDTIFKGLITAPVFRPTMEEFTDPLLYARKIRPFVEPFGMCKIIPPAGWKPPFSLADSVKFKVKQQHLGRLLPTTRQSDPAGAESSESGEISNVVESPKSEMDVDDSPTPKRNTRANSRKRAATSSSYNDSPVLSSKRKLSTVSAKNSAKCCVRCKGTGHQDQLHQCACCQRPFHQFCVADSKKLSRNWLCRECQLGSGVSYGYGDGGVISMGEYRALAEKCKRTFSELLGVNLDSPNVSLEEHYWKVLNMEGCDINVMYGSDVDTGKTGTGFPTSGEYRNSSWNVNNFPYSPESLMKNIGRKISGVMRPWLCKGFLFLFISYYLQTLA
jgi:hypothetical protein